MRGCDQWWNIQCLISSIFFYDDMFPPLAVVCVYVCVSLKWAGGRKPKKKSNQTGTYIYMYVVNEWNQASGGIKRERICCSFKVFLIKDMVKHASTASLLNEGRYGNGKKEHSLARAKVYRNLPNRIKLDQIIHLVYSIFYLFLSIDYITSWYT